MKESIYISRDKQKIQMESVIELIQKIEWASDRTPEDIRKSVENSTCYGVFFDERLIGFARIITDFVTTYYLMDVIIDEFYRGRGIGKMLMDEIMNDTVHLYGILHTDSAQKFYEPYGFRVTATSENGESIMEKPKKCFRQDIV